LLEDRLTPTTGGLASLSIAGLDELGIVSRNWQGSNTFVYPGQWVARFDGLPGTRVEQLASMRALTQPWAETLQVRDQLGSSGTFLLQTDPTIDEASLREILSPIGSLRYLEPNFALEPAAVPTDPSYPSQWALNNTGASGGVLDADIDAPEAWDLATGSSGVVVGVIDSGVMYTHPDLVSSMWVNPGEIAGDGLDNDGNGYVDDIHGYDFANNDSDPMDDDGHGTAVAGIIAAASNNGIGVTGINWQGKIMALKYARAGFVASTADVVEAVNYATMMRRDYGVNVRATNNSYGVFGFSQALADAIAAGGDEGILFVASAGNSNTDNDIGPQFPANYSTDAVLSVAATTRQDLKASFSSFGATTVDLGAPGLDVLTTRLGGGYSGFSGTSAASPVVAGVAALLWDYAPYATLGEIRSALLDGTDPIPALAGITVTGGRVNAHQSMLELGFVVRQVTPQANAILTTPPLSWDVRFSQPFDPSSLDASDLLVNGLPANSVSIVDSSTARFSFNISPVLQPGLQTVSILDQAIERQADADGVRGTTIPFRYDPSPLQVVTSTPAIGTSATPGLTTISLNWNEPIDPSSLSIRDLVLSQGRVVAASVTGPQSVEFAVTGIEQEGFLGFSVPAGALKDLFGNPSSPFSGSVDLDIDRQTFTKPFDRIGPLGGASFESRGNVALINQTGDADEFQIELAEGETILVVARPGSTQASLSAAWLGTPLAANSPSPGQAVELPLFVASQAGTYTLRITGNESTLYSFDLYRNTLRETSDTSSVSPLALEPSRLEFANGRYAVLGQSDVSPLFWAMNVNPGWSLGSQWSWGQPTGQGGDPSAGFTGTNVVGNNLNGTYPNRILTTNYATLGPVNLTGKTGVTLSFRRWLGIESSTLDRANIQVSRNGTSWTTVWQHSGATFQENSWSLQTYDISAVADNQPTVYVRFGIGPTSTSNAFSGWNIDDLVLRGNEDGPAKTFEEDVYTLDLSGSVGRRVDVAVAGLDGVDLLNSQLQLIGPNGSTILRTVASAPAGSNTPNDIVLQDYLVTEPGTYRFVLQTQTRGRYSLVVTDSIVLETEPNDGPVDPARSLDGTGLAVGYVGVPDWIGTRTFTVDSTQSLLQMRARVFLPNGQLDLPIVEQSPGSLDAAMAGTFTVDRAADGLTFRSANLDVLANAGTFLPGSAPADIAGQVSLLGLLAQAAIRNILFTLSSDSLAVDADGYFNASGLQYEFTSGEISYSALGITDTFPVNTPDVPNALGMLGRIEFLPGAARISIPLELKFVASVPLGFSIEFDFSANIVATTPLPINDSDAYTINLAAGDALELYALGLAIPARPANEFLTPGVEVLDPLGNNVPLTTFADASVYLTGGRFVASTAGTYRILVRALDGFGEYGLIAQQASPPVATITGPSAAVRGEPVSFVVTAQDNRPVDPSETWWFVIDWNGDGINDEVVNATSGSSITHAFAASGTYDVRVAAVRYDGVQSPWVSSGIDITPWRTRPNATQPSRTDLLIGGTDGIDVYLLYAQAMLVLVENNFVYGTILPNGALLGSVDVRPLPFYDGDLFVYAQGSADVVIAQLVTRPAHLFGGDGDDLILGGFASDWIEGGQGNDYLEGDSFGLGGNDTLLGGDGKDILVGGRGSDLLWGGPGSDLLVAGQVILPGYTLTGRTALQAEWRSDRSYDERVANILGVEPGDRLNENFFLIPDDTLLEDSTLDQLFGDGEEDFFFASIASDLVVDRQPGEGLLPL
jgi:hypothetical protein